MRTFPPCPCPSSPCPRAPQPSLGRWEQEEPPGPGEESRQALPRLRVTRSASVRLHHRPVWPCSSQERCSEFAGHIAQTPSLSAERCSPP